MEPTRQLLARADARRMEGVPSSSIDLVVTSPPYPMIAMWDAIFAALSSQVGPSLEAEDGERAFELMHAELDTAWAELARVLKPGGIACVNIGDATRTVGGVFRLYSNHVRILHTLERQGLQSLPHILWRKQTNAPNKFMGSGMLPPGAYVTLEHEHILVVRKGPPRRFVGPEERARRRRSAFFWEERNVWFSDVWDLKGARQALDGTGLAARERSGAFPFELAYRLVAMFSVQGDTVLDPFAGTATTLRACAALGRHGLGLEIAPELVEQGRASIAAPEEMNRWTRARLERHLAFMRERSASRGEPAYTNRPHGFPVVTAQETDLELELVAAVEPEANGGLVVRYGGAGAGQLDLGLGEEGSPP